MCCESDKKCQHLSAISPLDPVAPPLLTAAISKSDFHLVEVYCLLRYVKGFSLTIMMVLSLNPTIMTSTLSSLQSSQLDEPPKCTTFSERKKEITLKTTATTMLAIILLPEAQGTTSITQDPADQVTGEHPREQSRQTLTTNR